ncbi:NAC domain-containing protein 62-like [Syzygium oleosum]|uniref:NAC domain-containing protein 62-like n=1 Tax=Syzygium oleosum TaxID=219896 RepID=UPI0024BA6AED|nr:NAC domain-containing protein 62-like [Syzygium oleosum]
MGAVIIPRNLPVGYRFHPTDEEFVEHYLTNRVLGIVERPCIIPDVDICRWDPWELPQKFHGESIIPPDDKVQEWWFFCLQTSQQAKRSTPSGYWKKTGPDRNVKARDTNRVIGTKKTLVFHKGRGSRAINTKWVIHEFHLLANDLNRNYVLCWLKHTQDEKADNSTPELAHGAINLEDLDWDLHQPDHEDSLPELRRKIPLIQAMINSLIEPPFQPKNQVQVASSDLLQLLQPALRSQSSLPSNIHQFMNTESSSFMDFSLENGTTDESIQLESLFGTSEEDEDFSNMLNEDLFEEVEDVEMLSGDLFCGDFFDGDQMQAQYAQTSNSHDERPVLMENRRTRTIDSLHGFVPLEEKKGMVENKFNGSLVAPEKPMAPPVRAASVKYYGKDEEPRFRKVKQETVAKSIKPECIYLDETAARAKNGQISIMENRKTPTIESLHGVVPFEQKKGFIQSKFNSSHVSSTKSMELLKEPKTPKMPESPRIYINEEQRLEKVKKQGIALKNVKTECVSLDESAAKEKVLKYREHGGTSNSPRKTNNKEIEHAREKSNSVTALTGPSTKSTNGSTNRPLRNLVNLLGGILLLIAITYIHLPSI